MKIECGCGDIFEVDEKKEAMCLGCGLRFKVKVTNLDDEMCLIECTGCDDDFYNGKNDLNIKECWSFKRAKLIMRKEVPTWQPPPWSQSDRRFPSCYKRSGYVYLNPREVKQ